MNIDEMVQVIGHWGDETFGKDRLPGTMLKTYQELGEFSQEFAPDELADVLICVLDMAYLSGIKVSTAIIDKMRVNIKRKWKVDPKTRLAQHIKE